MGHLIVAPYSIIFINYLKIEKYKAFVICHYSLSLRCAGFLPALNADNPIPLTSPTSSLPLRIAPCTVSAMPRATTASALMIFL